MKKQKGKGDQVRKRIPAGRELPARFDDFLEIDFAKANELFEVEWCDLAEFELKRSAKKEAVPFLSLFDGGLVALWYYDAVPAIVHMGSEGERKVLALDFDDFLKGINAKCCGLPDVDEEESVYRIPGVKGRPNQKCLPELQGKFNAWIKKHSALQEPLAAPASEELRQRVFEIAKAMLSDGLSKVHTLSSDWWSMDFQIERDGTDLTMTYLDFGEWYPVPKKYKLGAAVTELLKLVKHKTRNKYELDVI